MRWLDCEGYNKLFQKEKKKEGITKHTKGIRDKVS